MRNGDAPGASTFNVSKISDVRFVSGVVGNLGAPIAWRSYGGVVGSPFTSGTDQDSEMPECAHDPLMAGFASTIRIADDGENLTSVTFVGPLHDDTFYW